MKARLLIAGALLTGLGACEQLGLSQGEEPAANNVTANQASGPKDPAANAQQISDAGITTSRSLQPVGGSSGGKPAASGTIDPALLIGRWGDNGDCTKDIQMFADGSFTSYTGGRGQWSLNGDELTIGGANGSTVLRLQSVDANNLIVINSDGSIGRSQRC